MEDFRPLTLDLGSTCGWSFHDGTAERWGRWCLSGSHAERLHLFSVTLSKFIRDHNPTYIAYEEVFFSPKDSIASKRLMIQLMGFVDVICFRVKIKPRLINPHEIKRATCGIMIPTETGRRRAVKTDVVAVVSARRGQQITDHNVADALAMMDIVMGERRAGHQHQAVPRSVMIAAALQRKRARGRRKAS